MGGCFHFVSFVSLWVSTGSFLGRIFLFWVLVGLKWGWGFGWDGDGDGDAGQILSFGLGYPVWVLFLRGL